MNDNNLQKRSQRISIFRSERGTSQVSRDLRLNVFDNINSTVLYLHYGMRLL